MKTQNKKAIAPLIILVVMLVFAVIGIGLTSSLSKGLEIGGTVLSLQQVSYTDSNQRWISTIVVDGGAESLYGQFTADEIVDGDYSAKKGFSLAVDTSNQKFSYPINKNDYSRPIYQYEILDKWLKVSPLTWPKTSACEAASSKVYTDAGSYNYCLKQIKLGYAHDLNNPSINQDINLEIVAGASKIKKTASYKDKNIDLGVYGDLRLIGGLWTGNAEPNAQNYFAINKVSGGYVVAQKSQYDNYVTYLNNLENTYSGVEGNVATINKYSANLLTGEKIVGAEIESQYESGGSYVIEVNNPVSIPLLVLSLDAELLGIEKSSGIPKILSVSNINFVTGSQGIVKVNVQNIGTSYGTFELKTSCPSTDISTSNSQQISLRAGASGSVSIPLYGTQLVDTKTLKCNIEAVDVNNPTIVDKKSFDVTIEPQKFCDDQTQFIQGNKVMKYNEQCTALEEVLDCGNLPVINIDGTYKCQSSGPGNDAALNKLITECREKGGEFIFQSSSSKNFLGESQDVTGFCKISNFIWWAFIMMMLGFIIAIIIFFTIPIMPLIAISGFIGFIGMVVWLLGLGGVF